MKNWTIRHRGDLSQRIELARRDEFGPLAGAFDRMVAELSELITQDSRSNIAKRLSYSA